MLRLKKIGKSVLSTKGKISLPEPSKGQIVLYIKGQKGEEYYNDLVVIKTIAEQYSGKIVRRLVYQPSKIKLAGRINPSIHDLWSEKLLLELDKAKTIQKKKEILKIVNLLYKKTPATAFEESYFYRKSKYKGIDLIEITKNKQQGMKLVFVESSSELSPVIMSKDFKFQVADTRQKYVKTHLEHDNMKKNSNWFRKLIRRHEGKLFRKLTRHALKHPKIINYELIDGQTVTTGSYYFINEEGYRILEAFSKVEKADISTVVDIFSDPKSKEITPKLVEAMAKF